MPPVRRVDRGRSHWYEDANGQRVPGVTTILKALPKDGLINWAATATADAAVNRWDELAAMPPAARLKELNKARYADRDTAANKGTAVHRLAQRLVAGEQVSMPDELAGHVESYVQFLDEWDVQPVGVEVVVMSHQYGWAGTLDLIAKLDGPDLPGPRALIDLKTSRSGIFGETALQLAGYRYADTYLADGVEVPMLDVDFCAAVWIRADGYEFRPMHVDEEQLRALRYLKEIAAWDATSRDLVGNPLDPPTTSRYRLTREEAVA